MTARAGLLTRREERPEDEPFCDVLFRETFGAMFAGLDDALRDLVLRQQFAAQVVGHRSAYPAARFDIVELDGFPVGRVVTDQTEAALTVVEIAIATRWRGRGLGTRLLGEICHEAASGGRVVRLRVLAANTGAHRFYERLGFVTLAASEFDRAMEWQPTLSHSNGSR